MGWFILAAIIIIGYGLREYILSVFVGENPDEDTPYPLQKKG
jgi:hypothetical protein